MSDDGQPRISPLRGLNHEDIVSQTTATRNGLSALRDDHYGILTKIREEHENRRNGNAAAEDGGDSGDGGSGLGARIEHVTHSLENLEVGIEEASVLLNLSDHFHRLEADRATLRLEMGRVQDENDWLRDELAETQRRMREALLELTDLQEEKRRWDFEDELRSAGSESNARPITPSKIPVGAWRVEEERDINRALNGEPISRSRAASPAPSRIPVAGGGWRAKSGAYRTLMEKEMAKKTPPAAAATKASGKRYFKLNAASNRPKIPTR